MDMNFGKLWEMVRTERHGMLQSMPLQRVEYNWVTEQKQQEYIDPMVGSPQAKQLWGWDVGGQPHPPAALKLY